MVKHISWRIAEADNFIFDTDVAELYGDAFVPYLQAKPVSVFFAEGSEIAVRMGRKIVAG